MRRLVTGMLLWLAAWTIGWGGNAALATEPTAAPIRVFGNWAVACDNGLRCGAVSLQPKAFDYEGIGLVITHDSGPDAQPRITLGHIFDGHRGDAVITVDGQVLVRGMLGKDETMSVPPAAVPGLIRALIIGTRLRLTGGGAVSDTSLSGAAAVFRYMDAQQGRADTVTALVAKGRKPASTVPIGTVPVVHAIRPPTTPRTRSPSIRARLWVMNKCPGPVGDDRQISANALSPNTTLVLVDCYGPTEGGENPSSDPYLVRGDRISRATFDAPVGMGEQGSPPSITAGSWDNKAATLTSFSRGRALADCADQEVFVWDGTRFRLVEHDEMDVCRGAQQLLSIWRARAVFDEATDPVATMPAGAEYLRRFVADHLRLMTYDVAYADLNGDQRPEALVYADGSSDCGSGGCDLYVLTRDEAGWRVVTDMSVTRPPIRILPTTHHGWHDLGVFVAGGGILPGHHVRLTFDGKSYPSNPTVPPAQPIRRPGGRMLIAK